jgi:glycerol kinase
MTDYILSLDQGTTSSRAIIFDEKIGVIASAQKEFKQHFPQDGWVEHNPNDIWSSTLESAQQAISKAKIEESLVSGIGITNQRETTIVWDRKTGDPIYNAIVWQDRRTSNFCKSLREKGLEEKIRSRTGLVIDPYFSASKIHWILNNVQGAKQRAETGDLAFGTVDTFLLWKLTAGKSHLTDVTNASRTQLYNIHDQCWDKDLLEIFEIPSSILPEVKDCAANFGSTESNLFGSPIKISGMIGDQQAAAFGQCCFEKGNAKSTYGTGSFLMLNTGEAVVESENRLLSTVAYRLNGQISYAVEGSIFMAGATIQWVRDKMKLIKNAADSEVLAQQANEDHNVFLVPAFTGLGAPYWDPNARASIFGMTRDTGAEELVSAALMAVCYQTKDLVRAIEEDGASVKNLKVDGGMANNSYLMQHLANVLNCRIMRPKNTETTAIGAAYIAGLQLGLFTSVEEIKQTWICEDSWSPEHDEPLQKSKYQGWLEAVKQTRGLGA